MCEWSALLDGSGELEGHEALKGVGVSAGPEAEHGRPEVRLIFSTSASLPTFSAQRSEEDLAVGRRAGAESRQSGAVQVAPPIVGRGLSRRPTI